MLHIISTIIGLLLFRGVAMCFSLETPLWIYIFCGMLSFVWLLATKTPRRDEVYDVYDAIGSGALSFEIAMALWGASVEAFASTCRISILIAVLLTLFTIAVAGSADFRKGRKPRVMVYMILSRFITFGILLFLTLEMVSGALENVEEAIRFQKNYEAKQELLVQASSLPTERPEENLETLSVMLDDAKWEAMSDVEKLSTLEVLLKTERSNLGLPFEMELLYQEASDGHTLGFYNHEHHRVCITSLALKNVFTAFETICHEAYHGYSAVLTECYLDTATGYQKLQAFNRVPVYLREYLDYKDCSGIETMSEEEAGIAYEKYASQALEEDARRYSSQRCNEIYLLLREYV